MAITREWRWLHAEQIIGRCEPLQNMLEPLQNFYFKALQAMSCIIGVQSSRLLDGPVPL